MLKFEVTIFEQSMKFETMEAVLDAQIVLKTQDTSELALGCKFPLSNQHHALVRLQTDTKMNEEMAIRILEKAVTTII